MEAFVYCWTDNLTNKIYIGSHKGSDVDGYICSSKLMLQEYHKRPQDFSRQIIAHGTWDDMFNFEGIILRAIDAKNDPNIYNMHNGSGDFRNKFVTEEAKKKISESKKGQPSYWKGKKLTYNVWNKGTKGQYSEEYIERLRNANLGKVGFWKNKKVPEHVKVNLHNVNLGNNNAGKTIQTPFGIFPSIDAASRELKDYSKTQIGDRVRSDKYPEWSRI